MGFTTATSSKEVQLRDSRSRRRPTRSYGRIQHQHSSLAGHKPRRRPCWIRQCCYAGRASSARPVHTFCCRCGSFCCPLSFTTAACALLVESRVLRASARRAARRLRTKTSRERRSCSCLTYRSGLAVRTMADALLDFSSQLSQSIRASSYAQRLDLNSFVHTAASC